MWYDSCPRHADTYTIPTASSTSNAFLMGNSVQIHFLFFTLFSVSNIYQCGCIAHAKPSVKSFRHAATSDSLQPRFYFPSRGDFFWFRAIIRLVLIGKISRRVMPCLVCVGGRKGRWHLRNAHDAAAKELQDEGGLFGGRCVNARCPSFLTLRLSWLSVTEMETTGGKYLIAGP